MSDPWTISAFTRVAFRHCVTLRGAGGVVPLDWRIDHDAVRGRELDETDVERPHNVGVVEFMDAPRLLTPLNVILQVAGEGSLGPPLSRPAMPSGAPWANLPRPLRHHR